MGVHRMLHTLFLVKFGVIDYSLSYLHSNFDVGHSSTLVSPIGQICTYIYNSNSATWCHGNTISNSSVSQIFYHYLFFSEFFFSSLLLQVSFNLEASGDQPEQKS